MTFDEFITGYSANSDIISYSKRAYEAGETHFQELLVAALAADFKDAEGALKFEREYPKTTELLKGI